MSESTNGIDIGSGTSAAMLAFLDTMVQRNYATPAAISPLKSAAKQIFQTVEVKDGDVDGVDVQTLDVDAYFARFQVAMTATGRITSDSVRAYRARFNRGLDLYRAYLTTGTFPKVKSRGASAPRPRRGKAVAAPKPSASPAQAQATPEAAEAPSTMVSYPFPMESGEMANLRLPRRLERRDAARLTAFIDSLTFDPQKQIGTGRPGADDEEPVLA